MTRKNLVLAPLFACSLLLIMGALDREPNRVAQDAKGLFVAQPASLRAGLGNLTPGQILSEAVAALSPEKIAWLGLNTWQKQVDGDAGFEAEGRLVRGPNQCARLEMTVHRGPKPTQVVTVSDGMVLARVYRQADRPATVTTRQLATPSRTSTSPRDIELVLNEHGCGGPYWLLKDLQSILDNLQAVAGIWKGKRVVRLTGSVKGGLAVCPESRDGLMAQTCNLYLDADSLWPHRIEWWASPQPDEHDVLLVQLEFRGPQINQPLSHEDCVREFTYQPD
jgi:hypothetical protein